MPFSGEPLILTEEERRELQQRMRSRTLPASDVIRSRMILLLADGVSYQKIQDLLDTTAPTIDAAFEAISPYTGHVVSCLGWSTHSLAPLSFRNATYSGVFTLTPLLTGLGQSRLGRILTEAAKLVDDGKLKPLLSERRFPPAEIEAAFSFVKSGSIGKVVVEILASGGDGVRGPVES
jgi:NADPH:quinone reductase